MSSQSMLDQAKFWEVVKYLVELDHKKRVDDICHDLSLNSHQLNSFITFLKEVNYEFEHFLDGDDRLLCPPVVKPKVVIELNLVEWLQFQAHFPSMDVCKDKPFHKDIVSKLGVVEQEYAQHDLFNPIETLERLMEVKNPSIVESGILPQSEVVSFIEEAIMDHDVLNLHWANKNLVVFPRKLVFLDGELSLVAEGLNDKCLLNMNIANISKVYIEDIEWQTQFSKLEVDDFVSSIRAISENEIRLVLKIYNREKFDNGLDHHHFGNPCIFTNPEGDFIWAASIEPTEQIYEWLSELGTDVEILDPLSFKKEFLNYCEVKLKKLA